MSRHGFALLLCIASWADAQSLSPAFALDEVRLGPSGGSQVAPTVLFTGTGFLGIWQDDRDGQGRDLWMAEVDRSGVTATSPSVPLLRAPGQQRLPSAAMGAGAFLVAWLDDSVNPCGVEVKAQRFTPTGQPLAAAVRLSTGACNADRPSVAWDATANQWLVVWGRHGAGAEVHGAFVDGSGALVVSEFVIAAAPNSAVTPWVVALPTGGLVVTWADDRVTSGAPNIYAVGVSSTGVVGAVSAVAPTPSTQSAPCVTPFGSGVLAVWTEGPGANTTDLIAQTLTAAGVPTGTRVVVATGGAVLSDVTCVTAPGDTVVLAFVDRRASQVGVYVRVLDATLGVSAEFPAALQYSYFGRDAPRLAVDGADVLLLVRGDADFTSGSDVHGRMLRPTQAAPLVGPSAFLVSTAAVKASHVNAAWNGARYLVTWRADGLNAAGSDSEGRLIAPVTGDWLGSDAGLRLSTSSANLVSYPSVAGAPDGGFFVSWGDNGSAGTLMGVTVSPSGAIGSVRVLSDTSSFVDTHVSRWLGDAWVTMSLKGGALRLRRTSVTGALVQAETVLLPTGSALEALDAASLGDVLMTVFTVSDGGLGVHAARWRPDAGLLDPAGLVIAATAANEVEPAIGAGETGYLVAWSEATDGGGLAARDVLATRLSASGVVLDVPPLRLGVGPFAEVKPAVGWDGLAWVVAWQRGVEVVASRVSASGAVLDATPVVIASSGEVAAAPHVQGGPQGEALVTWEEFFVAGGAFRGRGRFFTEPLVDGGLVGGEDAGSDAGPSDGGWDPDAGVAETDGGSDAGGPRMLGVGCGCGDATSMPVLLLWLLSGKRRKHRVRTT